MRKISKNLFIGLLSLLSLSSYGAISIISDYDDTIKITDVKGLATDPSRTILNSLFSKKMFYGTTELHKGLSTYTTETYVLSASPGLLRGRIMSALLYNDIRFDELITRSFFGSEDKLSFKKNSIQRLFNNSQDTFLLIGDDVELDPDIYMKMRELNPQKVKSIYIHNIINRKFYFNQNITSYITAFDIAIAEYKANRMTYDQALSIGEEVLNTPTYKMKELIPGFAHCPKSPGDFPSFLGFDLRATAIKVQTKIIKYCLLR